MMHPRRPMRLTGILWPKTPALAAAAIAAILLVALSAGISLADPSDTESQARKKLVDMVAGDISRSLAVENGPTFAAATFPGSTVYGMGSSSWGQLGVGIANDTNVPIELSPDVFGGPMAVSFHSLAVDKDGNLWASGNDSSGEFGDGAVNSSTMTFVQTGLTDISSVAAGTYHSLVTLEDGNYTHISDSGRDEYWCYVSAMASGEGSLGQLGDGRSVDTDVWSPVILPGSCVLSELGYYMAGDPPVVEKTVAFGNGSYIITDRGELYVFGENIVGELGVGTAGIPVDIPTEIISGGVLDVSAGSQHTLVLMADGSVMAMGLNSYGQFGDGTTDSSTTPKLAIPSGVTSIATGSGFSMFLMTDGSLQGVGNNSYGQLGTGDTAARNTLTMVASDVAGVSTGVGHVLYVTNSGALMGVGNNSYGQLGLGDFVTRYTADTIAGSGVVEAVAGYNTSYYMTNSVVSLEIVGLDRVYAGRTAKYRCDAVWADGRRTDVSADVFWSEDSEAASIEINTGTLDLSAALPGETFRLSAAYFGETATKDLTVVPTPLGGAVLYGHGRNDFSQLGQDTIVGQYASIELTGHDVVSAAAGRGHSLYVLEDGSVYAMGDNSYGQLGTGDTVPRSGMTRIASAQSAVAVGAGEYHSMIVMSDGSLRVMGRNDEGQLGTGSQYNRRFPKQVWDEGVVAADGGAGHTVFMTADGAIWNVGRNLEGQLGTGSTSGTNDPVKLHDSGATAIRAGKYHTLFTTGDPGIWGMGSNTYGQLGMDSTVVQLTTPAMLTLADVAHLAAGAYHTAYVTDSGEIYASGYNVAGQLGDGTNTDKFGFIPIDLGAPANGVFACDYSSFFRTGTRTYTDTAPTDHAWYGTGENTYGQFGDGTSSSVSTPKALPHFNQVRDLWTGSGHVLFTRGLPGDIDGDVQLTLHDAVRALQIMSGQYDGWPVAPYADIDGDGKIGLPEAQHALRRAGGF